MFKQLHLFSDSNVQLLARVRVLRIPGRALKKPIPRCPLQACLEANKFDYNGTTERKANDEQARTDARMVDEECAFLI